jgi:opacity protein-like surface antigen
MKKVLLAAILMSASAVAAADSADVGEAFLAVQAGRSQFASNTPLMPPQSGLFIGTRDEHFDKRDQAFGLSGGYRWPVTESIRLGVEGGYVDLGTATVNYSRHQDFIGIHVDSTEDRREGVKAPFVGLSGRWIIGDAWSLTARGGLARYRATLDVDGASVSNGTSLPGSHDSEVRTSVSYYYGIAFEYDITPQLGVALSADRFNPEFKGQVYGQVKKESVHVTVPGLRVEYRFL